MAQANDDREMLGATDDGDAAAASLSVGLAGAGAAAGCMALRTKSAANTAASAATASTIRRTAFMTDPKTLLRTRRQQASEPIILKAALMHGDYTVN